MPFSRNSRAAVVRICVRFCAALAFETRVGDSSVGPIPLDLAEDGAHDPIMTLVIHKVVRRRGGNKAAR